MTKYTLDYSFIHFATDGKEDTIISDSVTFDDASSRDSFLAELMDLPQLVHISYKEDFK